MRSLGQAPPQRMCEQHLGEFNQLADREIACRNPGCQHTWTWKRGAQLYQLQKHEDLKPPSRLCASCFEADKSVADAEITCRVTGCVRTWIWTRDAQQKHRAWVRRLQAKQGEEDRPGEQPSEAATTRAANETHPPELVSGADTGANDTPAEGSSAAAGGGAASTEPGPDKHRKRRRKKNRPNKRKLPEGPPEKMCAPCAATFAALEPQEQPCKVHGCTRTWTWSKEHQLRAWVALGGDDPGARPTAPKRMCHSCRDFCRARPDKDVACGRPGCSKSWSWKTGAQLQANLAGKTQDPIRLCDVCAKGEFLLAGGGRSDLPPGAEVMPCVVPGCTGTWTYLRGMELAGGREGDLPVDRMCDPCRAERDLPPRSAPEPEPTVSPVEGSSVEAPSAIETGVEAIEASEPDLSPSQTSEVEPESDPRGER